MRCNGSDFFFRSIDALHFFIGIGPIIGPVAVNPNIVCGEPAAWPVPRIGESTAVLVGRHRGDLRPIAVRPARQGHGLVIEKHFQAGWLNRTPKSARSELTVIGDVVQFEVDLLHFAMSGFVDSGKDFRIDDRLETGDFYAANQAHLFLLVSTIGNGTRLGAAVLCAKSKSLFQRIHPLAQPNSVGCNR